MAHEVVAARGDLPPVGEVAQRGPSSAHPEVRVLTGGLGEPDHQGHHDQDDDQRRQQPPGPAEPEAGQPDAPALAELADQEPGDQEAGEDVEDVDAEEAALEPADAEVERQDQEDGHGPQPVEADGPIPSGCGRPGRKRPRVECHPLVHSTDLRVLPRSSPTR